MPQAVRWLAEHAAEYRSSLSCGQVGVPYYLGELTASADGSSSVVRSVAQTEFVPSSSGTKEF